MKRRQILLALTIFLSVSFAAAQTAATRMVGAITAISGRTLTIQPDHGAPASINVGDTARVLRMQPGAKKLSDATPIALTDLAVGDRVLAVVNGDEATTVVAMKQADIAQKQQQEATEWREGAGGVVKTVDAAANTVTITSGAHPITIHITPTTKIRRYSPDSAEFAKSTLSTLDQIHPGDELRARGDRSANNSEITAKAIIAGTFRNIAGTVMSLNPAENTVTVHDLITKKPIVIHVNDESQLHELPAEMAQHLAMRLKAMGSGPHAGHLAQSGHPNAVNANANANGGPSANVGPSASGEPNASGGGLSRVLERTPTTTLSALHKGDAVIIVATQGTPASATALTLLSGVGPLLAAFPAGNQSVFSASWNLNGGGMGAGGAGGGGGGGGGQGGP